LWEASAKYGIPYFSNFVNSDMNPEDARSMCCRLRIDNRQLEYRGGGLFGSNPMTGSVGVVTINLPRLALKSKDEAAFMAGLDALMESAKESLEVKRKTLERLTEANLYPYTKFYLRSIKQRFDQYWKNHFSTIGIIGMNEAAENLLGVDIGSEKGKAFAEKTLDAMREKLVEFQKTTGNNYNLEATPAEGTTYRLAQLDKTDFPKTAHFAKEMGVTYGRITIREQKTRWGSCSSAGNLNYNWKLVLMPEHVMDYVVIHELAHRKEMNHSARFYAVVAQQMPDYKVWQSWLKEHGREY
jgi:anaerobic ribonucleoside-triphosphate reductase